MRVSGVGWGSATMTRNSHSITPAVVPVASTGPLGEAVTVNAQPVGERGMYLSGREGGRVELLGFFKKEKGLEQGDNRLLYFHPLTEPLLLCLPARSLLRLPLHPS